MAQYELVKNTNQNKIKSIAVVVLILVLIVSFVLLFRSTSRTGPSDGKTVICVKFMRTQELIKEFNTIGINKTNAPMAEPDLNSCTHLICSDTYMRITNDVDFIWSNDKRQQYVECINSRRSYPHLKILYSVRYTPHGYFQIGNDARKREQFTRRLFNMVTRNNFDGLNLNWQHSMEQSVTDMDVKNGQIGIGLLLKDLSEKFELLIGTIHTPDFVFVTSHKENTANRYKDAKYIEFPIELQ